MEKFIVGVSGASGTILAYEAVKTLASLGYHIDLIVSRGAIGCAAHEMGEKLATPKQWLESFPSQIASRITLRSNNDFYAPSASGSAKSKGMLVIPCSMATLSAIATGLSDNLIRRSADVAIKERRPLVVVPRESPFSSIHLEHMLKISQLGGAIVPPIPAWYSFPKSLDDVHQTIVGRCLDLLGIENATYPRWEGLPC